MGNKKIVDKRWEMRNLEDIRRKKNYLEVVTA
jgi:hypothetical protein